MNTFLAFAGLASAILTLLALGAAASRLWRRTIGSRQVSSSTLDRLAVETSREYVRSLLGVPATRTPVGNLDLMRELHLIPHAVVAVFYDLDDVAQAITIVITEQRLRYDFSAFTHGVAPVRAGDPFPRTLPGQGASELDEPFHAAGAYHFFSGLCVARGGRPAHYQVVWLSWTEIGMTDRTPTAKTVNSVTVASSKFVMNSAVDEPDNELTDIRTEDTWNFPSSWSLGEALRNIGKSALRLVGNGK